MKRLTIILATALLAESCSQQTWNRNYETAPVNDHLYGVAFYRSGWYKLYAAETTWQRCTRYTLSCGTYRISGGRAILRDAAQSKTYMATIDDDEHLRINYGLDSLSSYIFYPEIDIYEFDTSATYKPDCSCRTRSWSKDDTSLHRGWSRWEREYTTIDWGNNLDFRVQFFLSGWYTFYLWKWDVNTAITHTLSCGTYNIHSRYVTLCDSIQGGIYRVVIGDGGSRLSFTPNLENLPPEQLWQVPSSSALHFGNYKPDCAECEKEIASDTLAMRFRNILNLHR